MSDGLAVRGEVSANGDPAGMHVGGGASAQNVRSRRGSDDLDQIMLLARREAEVWHYERTLHESAAQLEAERQELDSATHELETASEDLSRREDRFAHRWRWLIRTWRRAPRSVEKSQRCDLLFVPTADGYRVLEQKGLALRPGAELTGLLGERRRFVVAKVGLRPFEERWCAYLNEEPVISLD